MFGLGLAEIGIILLAIIIFVRPEDAPKIIKTCGQLYRKGYRLYYAFLDELQLIMDWDDRQTYKYIPDNGLPYHPLEGMGYDSVGDHHSTSKVSESSSKEDSRHGGHGRECGLHLDLPEGHDFSV